MKLAVLIGIMSLSLSVGALGAICAGKNSNPEPQSKPIYKFENLREVSAPDSAQKWFAEVEDCTGLSKPFEDMNWRLAKRIYDARPERRFANPDSWGLFTPPNTITLNSTLLFRRRSTTKHEMMHYLLYPRGGHPSPPFGVCNK